MSCIRLIARKLASRSWQRAETSCTCPPAPVIDERLDAVDVRLREFVRVAGPRRDDALPRAAVVPGKLRRGCLVGLAVRLDHELGRLARFRRPRLKDLRCVHI